MDFVVSPDRVRAIALLSGGLDSTLAAALVKAVGIEVVGLTVRNMFGTGRERARYITSAAEAVGIPLLTLRPLGGAPGCGPPSETRVRRGGEPVHRLSNLHAQGGKAGDGG
jgi:diphthamide synthase (EF-2-diphthine--ammonia ligase)